MTLEFLDKWIAALLSGKYAQDFGSLRIEKSSGVYHDALGVGIDVLREKFDDIEPLRLGYRFSYNYVLNGYPVSNSRPPVIKGSGFIDSVNDYKICDVIDEMSRKKMSFRDIVVYLNRIRDANTPKQEKSHGQQKEETKEGC